MYVYIYIYIYVCVCVCLCVYTIIYSQKYIQGMSLYDLHPRYRGLPPSIPGHMGRRPGSVSRPGKHGERRSGTDRGGCWSVTAAGDESRESKCLFAWECMVKAFGRSFRIY